MTRRSLQASDQGIQALKKAVRKKKGGQTYLAGAVGCSRQTIWSLLKGNPTDCDVFMDVCQELDLDWKDIATPEIPEPEQNNDEDLDLLVQQARKQIKPYVQKRCGTMRVLDMEQAIGLDSIYTRVNILEKLTRNRRRAIADLLDRYESEEFDRFVLSKVEEQRVPGLEAATRHSKLLILGKPGAGKTTFLKWVALQCMVGQFCNDLVPVFVTLKAFAEAPKQPALLDYIQEQLKESGIRDASVAETLLRSGRSLVLLDGLDEVREVDHDRVLQEICNISERFDANRFIMTCRIAAQEYTFEQFTEVEVADFDQEQIADFATKWFQVKDPDKIEPFLQELETHPPIQELATNPLLLTLLCLVFGEQMGFPSNRSELYKEGLDVLLKKWDAKRNIKRQEVYKQLSLQRKEDLLSQIAFTTFERGEYFFKQATLEEQITDYIRNLPNANSDPEALQLDSEAVLKSIEAQHGLLVERARGIYSFSHLTFHEYFTAKQIKEKRQEGTLQILVNHLTEKRWREVFLLTTGMLQNADALVQVMKTQVDALLVGDETLQLFLSWVQRKSSSVDVPYKPAATRAFYLDLALDCDLAHNLDFARNLALARDFALDLALACALDLGFARDLALAHDLALAPGWQHKLQELRDELPDMDWKNREQFRQWWKENGQAWTEKLRTFMVEHCDIGHDWQFSKEQKQLLQQYYDANLLLVNCLNSDCYVSREVRQEIEETLLLPIAEIERRSVSDG